MLSQSVGYAAVALGIIANSEGKPILVKDIADAGDIPSPFLAKIIHTLSRKGLVETQRGIGGGVSLQRKPDEITLYDLCACFDDPVLRERCMLGNAECSDERACPCHKFWKDQRKKQIEFLRRTTIKDLAAFEEREIVRIGKTSKPKN